MRMAITKSLRAVAVRAQRRVERAVLPLGNSVECPFCGWTGWRFLSAGRLNAPNRLCPGCGSIERYRMLPLVLPRVLADRPAGAPPPRVLELAPTPCFTAYCRRQGWRYVSSDLASPRAMVHGDLRCMPLATGAFDVIVCFHVLEHIHEDHAAFPELARMLAPTGTAILCVPLRGDRTQEGAPAADWERLYGQHDHVRYYGADIEDRMRAGGLAVTRLDTRAAFSAAELDRHALRGDDRYLFLARRAA
jgi:SAM-dependent methyltransferase